MSRESHVDGSPFSGPVKRSREESPICLFSNHLATRLHRQIVLRRIFVRTRLAPPDQIGSYDTSSKGDTPLSSRRIGRFDSGLFARSFSVLLHFLGSPIISQRFVPQSSSFGLVPFHEDASPSFHPPPFPSCADPWFQTSGISPLRFVAHSIHSTSAQPYKA